MAILAQMKHWLAHFLLRTRQYKPGQLTKPVTLANARSIAIVYNTNNFSQRRKEVQQFKKSLNDQNKTVHLLEFLEEKGNTANVFATKHFSFLSKEHLNFLHLPKRSALENFSEHSYDLLICLCHKNCLPLYYTSAIAKANFKIGMYNPDYTHIFDLMFEFDEDQTQYNLSTIESYLENMQKN